MQESITLRVQRLSSSAKLPRYATKDSACFDLCADIPRDVTIYTNMTHMIGTGIAVEVPRGWVMNLYSRSGLSVLGVHLGNGVGKVDPDYRGEVGIVLRNDGSLPFTVHPGDRVAQAMLEPAPRVIFEEVEALSGTARGAGGFGSTGR